MIRSIKKKEPFDVITDPPDITDGFSVEGRQIVEQILGDQLTGEVHGDALLDIAAKEPTLDRYLDRSPKLLTDTDYEELVSILQRKRAMFISAEQKKKEPKEETDTPSED